MRKNIKTLPAPLLKVVSDVLKKVEEFKHLGSVIKCEDSLKREIITRIACTGIPLKKN